MTSPCCSIKYILKSFVIKQSVFSGYTSVRKKGVVCPSTAMILMLGVNMISFHLVVSENFDTPLAEGGWKFLGEEGLVCSLN